MTQQLVGCARRGHAVVDATGHGGALLVHTPTSPARAHLLQQGAAVYGVAPAPYPGQRAAIGAGNPYAMAHQPTGTVKRPAPVKPILVHGLPGLPPAPVAGTAAPAAHHPHKHLLLLPPTVGMPAGTGAAATVAAAAGPGVDHFLQRTGTPPMSPRVVTKQTALSQLAAFTAEMMTLIWRGVSLAPYSQDYINFHHFISKILRSTHHNITAPVIILSLLYTQRFKLALPPSPAGPEVKSEYGVWTTAVILADAYVNDNSFTNKSWSIVTGFSPKDCAIMKRNFLKTIRFHLAVTVAEYQEWILTLERVVSLDRHAFHPISEIVAPPAQSLPSPAPSPLQPQLMGPARSALYAAPPYPPVVVGGATTLPVHSPSPYPPVARSH